MDRTGRRFWCEQQCLLVALVLSLLLSVCLFSLHSSPCLCQLFPTLKYAHVSALTGLPRERRVHFHAALAHLCFISLQTVFLWQFSAAACCQLKGTGWSGKLLLHILPHVLKLCLNIFSSHLQVEIAGILLVIRPQKTLLKKRTSKLFQPVLVPNHLLCFRISDLN